MSSGLRVALLGPLPRGGYWVSAGRWGGGMKVAVIEGTYFFGVRLVEHLFTPGHRPRLLVGHGCKDKVARAVDWERVTRESQQPHALSQSLAGGAAVINRVRLVRESLARGIRFEAMHRLGVEAVIAAAQWIRRVLLLSAKGARPDETPYRHSRHQAEVALKASGLAWTIFRPSVTFGDPRGRLAPCSRFKREAIDTPLPALRFVPGWLPTGASAFKLAPVAVADAAAALVLALTNPGTESQTFRLGGPERLSWRRFLETIAAACGRTKRMPPAPARTVGVLAALLDRLPWHPITKDRLRMRLEDEACIEDDGSAWLGLTPTRFGRDALVYLRG